MVEFTKEIEKNTPQFEDIYTGLAQPLEDKDYNLTEDIYGQDFGIITIKKEEIFNIINSKNGEETHTFINDERYIKDIYSEIKKYFKTK